MTGPASISPGVFRFNLTPVTARAYEFLKARILSGIFKPGEFLSAGRISNEIGVSRTPIKDALRYLEIDGLVTIEPKVGALVVSFDDEQLREMLGYRKALLTYAVEEAAQMRSANDLKNLDAILGAMQKQVELMNSEETIREVAELGAQLHHRVVQSARNREVARRFDHLWQILNIYWRGVIGKRQLVVDCLGGDVADYGRLLDALSERDASHARQVLSVQLDRQAGLILEVFVNRKSEHPLPADMFF